MRILITGGTGFIGSHLIPKLLDAGHEVLNLSRKGGTGATPRLSQIAWDGKRIPEGLGPVDAVINLAGAGVADKRWTAAYKEQILNSRIMATRACVEYINQAPIRPAVFISASGFNYYGGDFDQTVTESSPPGSDFLSTVCIAWENEARAAQTRTVFLRISVVLGRDGGPLPQMMQPYRFFIGGPMGSGKQGFPWMQVDDLCEAILFCMNTPAISGPVNMCSPNPINQRTFSSALGQAMGRPSWFRMPKWLLKLVFGELSVILWGGGWVSPRVLQDHGYKFRYAHIGQALHDMLRR